MKRKVKKGVKILTQLVEGQVTFDSKEFLNSSSPLTMGTLALQTPSIFEDKENNSSPAHGLKSYLVYLIYVYRSYGYIILQQLDVSIQWVNFFLRKR